MSEQDKPIPWPAVVRYTGGADRTGVWVDHGDGCEVEYVKAPAVAGLLALPDTGDHVLHTPTGETWLVAYVRDGHLCACGWPESLVPVGDCVLVKKATFTEQRDLLRSMAETTGSRGEYARAVLAATQGSKP